MSCDKRECASFVYTLCIVDRCVSLRVVVWYTAIRLIHESAISRGCLVVVPILGSGM